MIFFFLYICTHPTDKKKKKTKKKKKKEDDETSEPDVISFTTEPEPGAGAETSASLDLADP